MIKLIVIIAGALILSACATNGRGINPITASYDDGSFNLTSIPTAALPRGACGMILWTLDANEPSPILRYIAGETAIVSINGVVIDLTLAEAAGGGEFGVFESQTYIGGAGYDANVQVNFGLGFDGGVYLERGLVKVRSQSGWEVVAPAAGIAGCRKK